MPPQCSLEAVRGCCLNHLVRKVVPFCYCPGNKAVLVGVCGCTEAEIPVLVILPCCS